MCARITVTTSPAEVADLFGLAHDTRPAAPARYSVAPSALVPVVRVANGGRELIELRWGLVPHWNTDPKHAGFVNARAETAADKPAFRETLRLRRCVVVAGGFYEWKAVGRKGKRPYFVRAADGGPLALAAVWDRWDGPAGAVEAVAVLTVAANDMVRPLHARMPAVLDPAQFAAWLDPQETRPARVLPLLAPYPAERLELWPVDPRVNAVTAAGAELLARVPEPAEPRGTQLTLFDAA